MPIFTVGAAGTTSSGFDVTRGIRFADNAYQTRTPSSSSNRRTFTISVWVKLSQITTGTQYFIGGASSGSDYALLRYENFNFEWIAYNGSGNQTAYLRTTALYKDPSAWYHIVIASDTTQATASNRTKMYVNGVQITDFQTENYPSQNADYNYNHNIPHTFGAFNDGASSQGSYLEGYMCEIVSIDGQQLTPTSFGEFESNSGIWQPIDPSGLTFGTNGFYLNFATKATDAVDASGNGNNFSSTNVVASDHSLDTCMNNYNTLNILTSRGGGTMNEGNLRYTASGSDSSIFGTLPIPPGMKVYFEVKLVNNTAQNAIGIHNQYDPGGTFVKGGNGTGTYSYKVRGAASVTQYFNNGSSTNTSISNYANDTIIGVAVDNENGQIHYSANGTYINSSDPTDNNPAALVTGFGGSNEQYLHFSLDTTTSQPINEYNFGSPPYTISSSNSDANGHGNFEYAVPSGYYALNTKNLAEFG